MTEAPAQGQGQAAPEAEGTQAAESQEQQQDRTLTWEEHQAELKRVGSKEKKDGRTARENDLLKATGAESIDDIISGYTEYQGIQEAVTTEADRANTRAEKMEARAKTAEERYTNTLREFALRDSLRDAGINPERLKGAMRLADLSALQVDGEGNVSGIEDVVAAVQQEAPEFFGTSERQRVNAPQTDGTGVQRPGPTGDPKTDMGNSLFSWLTQPAEEERGTWP
jgi:hypothetical protein